MQYLPRTTRYFVISIVCLPLLFQYMTPLSGLTCGDFFLMVCGLFYVFSGRVKIEWKFALLIAYVIILTLSCLLNGSLMRITTTIHYLAYLFIVMLMSNLVRYRGFCLKIYNKVCLVSAGLMVVQTIVLQITGICIPGVLTFLPLTDEDMYNYADVVMSHNSGRCMSFFAEPSHFAVYVLPFLVFKLFLNNIVTRKDMVQAIFVSISLIMCASSTGILSASIVWGLFIVISIMKGNISFKNILLLIISAVSFFIVLMNSFGGEYLSNADIYERQSEGRFAGFSLLDEVNISDEALFFGAGMNDLGDIMYLPGWPRLLFYYGIVGSIIYILTLFSCTYRNTVSFLLLSLLGVLMVGTEVNFGCYFVLYMLCIYITKDIPLFSKH